MTIIATEILENKLTKAIQKLKGQVYDHLKFCFPYPKDVILAFTYNNKDYVIVTTGENKIPTIYLADYDLRTEGENIISSNFESAEIETVLLREIEFESPVKTFKIEKNTDEIIKVLNQHKLPYTTQRIGKNLNIIVPSYVLRSLLCQNYLKKGDFYEEGKKIWFY